nr:hypothetical protein [Tanacetum cinerariifolium]
MDGKKILINESTIRRDLQLNDAEGVDCLPNAVIFEQLTLMGETPLFPTMMVQAQEEIGKGLANPTDPLHTPTIIQPSTSQTQKTKQHRKPRRKVTQVPQPSDPTSVVDKAINEEMDNSLEWDATTATSLDVNSGGGPRCQETMRDTVAQTRVLDLETTKTTHALEIDSLKRRVKRLEKIKWSRTHRLKILYKVGLSARVKSSEDEGLGEEDASKQGTIANIDANKDITLVSTHDKQMFNADQDLGGEEEFVALQDENVVEKEVDAI